MIQAVVIADNKREYDNFLRENKAWRRDYPYANSVDSLLGLYGVRVIFVGTWCNRADASELREHADIIGVD